MREYARIFNDDKMALSIYRAQREKFEGLFDPLRIKITEGAESEE